MAHKYTTADFDEVTNDVFEIARQKHNAWDVIAAARDKGIREESTRRAIWRLMNENRLSLTNDRQLVQTKSTKSASKQ